MFLRFTRWLRRAVWLPVYIHVRDTWLRWHVVPPAPIGRGWWETMPMSMYGLRVFVDPLAERGVVTTFGAGADFQDVAVRSGMVIMHPATWEALREQLEGSGDGVV